MKKIILMLTIGIANLVHSQQGNGEVISVISSGVYDFSVIKDLSNSTHYKSSLYEGGSLETGQNVNLTPTNNPDIVQVGAESLSSPLFANKIENYGRLEFHPTSRVPELVNEILFFNNRQEVDEFYAEIEYFMESTDPDVEDWDKLSIVEESIGAYSSYRIHFDEIHNLENGLFASEEEINEIIANDFVNDNIYKTLLNKHRMLGIGDSIYYWQKENYSFRIHKNDLESLQLLVDNATQCEQGKNCDIVEKGNSTIYDRIVSEQIYVLSPYFTTNTDKGLHIIDLSLYYQTDWAMLSSNNCDPYTKTLRLIHLSESVIYADPNLGSQNFNMDLVAENQSYNVILTINWGDGSEQIVNGYYGQDITHTYPSGNQEYFPSTVLTIKNYYGDFENLVDDDNNMPSAKTDVSCTDADAQQWDSKIVGNWKLAAKVWTIHNWLGHKVGSFTHAYKNQNGWTRKKATIATFIHGKFRNQECVYVETKSGNRHKNNAKTTQKTKNKLFQRRAFLNSNSDVTSYHTLHKGSVGISLNMELIVCP